MIKTTGSFLLAVIAAYLLGAIFISQGNIAAVVALGFDVGVGQRLDAAVHDTLNMTDIYLPLVAISLLLGFPVAYAIVRKRPHLRLIGYTMAGFVALIAIHVIIKAVVGISGVAPTRTLLGLLCQGIAGGVGGYLFYRLTTRLQSD